MEKEWWTLKENELFPINISLDEITYLYGRKTPDGWEYAFVGWGGGDAYLNYTLKGGMQYDSDGTEMKADGAEKLCKEYLGEN